MLLFAPFLFAPKCSKHASPNFATTQFDIHASIQIKICWNIMTNRKMLNWIGIVGGMQINWDNVVSPFSDSRFGCCGRDCFLFLLMKRRLQSCNASCGQLQHRRNWGLTKEDNEGFRSAHLQSGPSQNCQQLCNSRWEEAMVCIKVFFFKYLFVKILM